MGEAVARRAAPEARLLVLIRDPVERFVSGMAHTPVVPALHLGSVFAEAVTRGQYATALAPWEAELVSGRLLVLQYEACVADPAGQLARTYRFLGLDDDFVPAALLQAREPHHRGQGGAVARRATPPGRRIRP